MKDSNHRSRWAREGPRWELEQDCSVSLRDLEGISFLDNTDYYMPIKLSALLLPFSAFQGQPRKLREGEKD